ncbi:MAG: hypothetical protein FJ291_30335 [Planctomycetes bacterium]|nr:hypothetical protein [Planctomycetota bacterium]
MTRLGELSPIDPTTGNQFNPPDPLNPKNRLGICVEDLSAYQDFLKSALGLLDGEDPQAHKELSLLQPFLQKLAEAVHPFALGNVYRDPRAALASQHQA